MKGTIQQIVLNETDTLISAGEVVELRFREGNAALSLRSAKLLHLLVDLAGAKACEDVEHTVSIAALNYAHLEAQDLIDCIRELQQTLVELTYRNADGEMEILSSPLLADVRRPKQMRVRDGRVSFRLSTTLRLILENSNHWAALSRDAVLAFESRYALRLYELIALRANLRHKNAEIFDLMDLRRRFGVPDGKLAGWSPFRQKALEPAIAEVNQLSGFIVSYEAIKQGRRVDRVKLSWKVQQKEGRSAVATELVRHSAGRKARRDGAAEIVTPSPPLTRNRCDFPAYGGLRHGRKTSHWGELAEKHVKRLPGGHTPDLSVLANEFRAFCERRKIPLNAASVEKSFIGFCEKYNPPAT